MKYTYNDLAQMIDHALLHPTLSDQELESGCALAHEYKIATVCVKPFHVKQAVSLLKDSEVKVGCVIGFPHGTVPKKVKRYETKLACQGGAVEVDMVINHGKAMSADWHYVSTDIKAVCEEAHSHGARVKVIFSNDYLKDGGAGLTGDQMIAKLCEVSEDAGADWVKTSTGFDYVKRTEGGFECLGATMHDLKIMRSACSEKVQVKAAGGVRDLDTLIEVRNLGATRCGTSSTQAILDEYNYREINGHARTPDHGSTEGY